jgi:hypothetical protein
LVVGTGSVVEMVLKRMKEIVLLDGRAELMHPWVVTRLVVLTIALVAVGLASSWAEYRSGIALSRLQVLRQPDPVEHRQIARI